MDPVELAALRLAIGEQASEQLPGIATDALVRGLDSPALREAAGTSPREVRDATDLFKAALAELEIDLPDEQEALWRLVRYTAMQIKLTRDASRPMRAPPGSGATPITASRPRATSESSWDSPRNRTTILRAVRRSTPRSWGRRGYSWTGQRPGGG
jgi:hypothetical protein